MRVAAVAEESRGDIGTLSTASCRLAELRRDHAITKYLPRSSRPHNTNLLPLPSPVQQLLQELPLLTHPPLSFHAAAPLLGLFREVVSLLHLLLRRRGLGARASSITGTAKKPPATLPAWAGLPETSGTAWELPLRATITLLLVTTRHPSSFACARSHAACSSPLQRSNDFKADSVTQTLLISSQ